MGKIVIEDQACIIIGQYVTLHDVACWVVWRLVNSLSVVNRRFVGAVVLCQNVLQQREIFEIMGITEEETQKRAKKVFLHQAAMWMKSW